MSRKVNVWTVDFTEGRRIGMEDGIIIGKYIAIKCWKNLSPTKGRCLDILGIKRNLLTISKKAMEN